MSFLIWTGLTGVPAVWPMWWRNSVCFYTRCFYFCLCVMSHTATVSASSLDLLQHPSSFSNRTFHHSPFHFTLLATSPHSSAALEETCNVICYHYSSNIYTTLSKLHLAGNMFQRLSTPNGVAGGLASIKRCTAKIGR